MRIRWIIAVTVAVLAIGGGVAWAAIPNSDGSVDLCGAPEAAGAPTGLYGPVYMTDSGTQCHAGQTRVALGATGPAGAQGQAGAAGAAGPAGASSTSSAAAAPQVYETFGTGDASLNGTGLKLTLSLPVGTYDVQGSIEGYANDYHEKPILQNGQLVSYEAVPRSMGVFCTLDSPTRQSTSAGAAPVGSGAFTAGDHATIALTAAATLTFTCHGDDSETSKQTSDPKNGYINAAAKSQLSATMVNSAAVAAVVQSSGRNGTFTLPSKVTINKAITLTTQTDSGNDKKVSQILSQIKALAHK